MEPTKVDVMPLIPGGDATDEPVIDRRIGTVNQRKGTTSSVSFASNATEGDNLGAERRRDQQHTLNFVVLHTDDKETTGRDVTGLQSELNLEDPLADHRGRDCVRACATVDERVTINLYCRAALANYSAIFVWVGMWDLLTFYALIDEEDVHLNFLAGPLPGRTALYAVLGIVLCLMTDTMLTNGGISGGWLPRWVRLPCCAARVDLATSRVVFHLRIVFGLLGTLLMWVGTYNYFFYWFLFTSSPEFYSATDDDFYATGIRGQIVSSVDPFGNTGGYFAKDLLLLFFGYGCLFASCTFWDIAGVYPENHDTKSPGRRMRLWNRLAGLAEGAEGARFYSPVHKGSGLREHCAAALRAYLSVVGQVRARASSHSLPPHSRPPL